MKTVQAALAALMFVAAPDANAAEPDDNDHDPGGHATEHDHAFEIGVALGGVYLIGEGEFTGGAHLHAIVALGHSWGLGVGVERLFDDHGHTTVSGVVQYRILDAWSVIVAPGVTFEDEAPSELAPSVHLETAYEFTLGHFHVGPSLELAIDTEDAHATLGAHFGFGF